MGAFEIRETELRPGWRAVAVVGELDLNEAGKLEEALERAADYDLVLIDLESCEFMDSTGIAACVHAYRAMADNGKRLALVGATKQVLRVLSVSGLTRDGLYFESMGQAVEAIDGPSPADAPA